MTTPNEKNMPDYTYDLVFDETEIGGTGAWSYYGLVTDFQTPADILIRLPNPKYSEYPTQDAQSLANEVVKRWNAYNADLAEIQSSGKHEREVALQYCEDIFPPHAKEYLETIRLALTTPTARVEPIEDHCGYEECCGPAPIPADRYSDWYPMITAPKDGQYIRILCENGKEDIAHWSLGEWSSEYGNGNPVKWYPALPAVERVDVDTLANIIRTLDGNKTMGAGELAEALICKGVIKS